MNSVDKVRAWIDRDLLRWRHYEECANPQAADDGYFKFIFYTAQNEFSITVGADYLGCIATSRYARTGEHHLRGSDLPDGKCTEETWRRILADIVAYELVPYVPPAEPKMLAPVGGVVRRFHS